MKIQSPGSDSMRLITFQKKLKIDRTGAKDKKDRSDRGEL